MDHNGSLLYQGAGCNQCPTSRRCRSFLEKYRSRRRSTQSKAEGEEKAESKVAEGRQRRSGRSVKKVTARDGSVSAHPQKSSASSREAPLVPDDVPLDQSISICRLFASFPRWILKTRSSFSWFLARTFSLRCWGCHSSFRGLPTSTHGLWDFFWKWPQAKSSPMDYVGQEESAACDHCGPQLPLQ